MFTTGSFPDGYREWKRTGTGHKTWENFKVDLDLAFKEMRESQLTSQDAGFSPQNANAVADFRAKTAEAIKNLANAMIADRNIIQHLTETNQQLTRNCLI